MFNLDTALSHVTGREERHFQFFSSLCTDLTDPSQLKYSLLYFFYWVLKKSFNRERNYRIRTHTSELDYRLSWNLPAIPIKILSWIHSWYNTFLNSPVSLILTSESRRNFFQATRGLTPLVGHIPGQKNDYTFTYTCLLNWYHNTSSFRIEEVHPQTPPRI